MSEYKLDIARYQSILDRLDWIKERKAELEQQEHEAWSQLEELLPPARTDRENDKIVGVIGDKPVIEWRPTKQRRLNVSTLKGSFPKVYEFCREEVYGRSRHLLDSKE